MFAYDPVAISKDMKFIYKKNNIDKLKANTM